MGFYKDLAWHAPKIFLQSLVRTDTVFDILSKIVLVFFVGYSNPVTETALRVWTFLTGAKVKLNGVPLWWLLIVLGIIFLHGLFRYAHEEQQRLRLEKEALAKQVASEEQRITLAEKRRATRNLLGKHHAKGQKLARSHPGVEEMPKATVEEISEWGEGVYRLIRAAYGSGRAEIFLSGKDSGYKEVWLQERLAQLVRLMEQTSEMELRPDFDPEDFALQNQERGSGSS